MRLLVVLLAAASSAVAESVLDYTKLPACARQCAVLAQAEGGCVPPAAPVTNQGIYQSCVCQSALLTALHSSGALCQPTGCSDDDAAKISTYYNALCNGPVVVPVATVTLATSTSATATSKSTSTSGAGAAGNSLTGTNKKDKWIDRTWRWLVFIIVVIVAMVAATVLGIWLKRRHDRKVDARKANVSAHPDPPPPGTGSRSRPGTGLFRNSLPRNSDSATIVNGVTPTPPMTAVSAMSLGPSNRDLDGGVGAIAPRRQPNKLRSRSSTLQSLGLSNSSRVNIPDPVAWGPHQYAAQRAAGESAPPSPVSAITPPPANPVFRNREFVASEPRFQSFHPSSPSRNWSPSLLGSEIDRPHTAGAADQGAANAPASSARIPL